MNSWKSTVFRQNDSCMRDLRHIAGIKLVIGLRALIIGFSLSKSTPQKHLLNVNSLSKVNVIAFPPDETRVSPALGH